MNERKEKKEKKQDARCMYEQLGDVGLVFLAEWSASQQSCS